MSATDPLLRALQALVRGAVVSADQVPAERRTNFGHVFQSKPRLMVEPKSAEDVVAVIRFARGHALPVTARGSAHSQSNLAVSDGGILLYMPSGEPLGEEEVLRRPAEVRDGRVLARS